MTFKLLQVQLFPQGHKYCRKSKTFYLLFKCITSSLVKLYVNILTKLCCTQYCPSPNTQVRVADTPSVLGAGIGQRHPRLCRQAQTQRTSLFAEPDPHMIRGPEYLVSQLGNLQENSTEET